MRGPAASGTGISRSSGGRSILPFPTAGPAVRASALSPAIHPLNGSPERPQPLVDPLVTALDLSDVVDDGVALRRERGEQHRHARPDVRALHHTAPEGGWARDHRPVRIAQ